MGKLMRLELFNFKSYKGHHVMLFGDSYFTSIIGPNGSGKSNSMDAISFVLGIKSSHLRSSHLRDLVYRGRVLQHSKIHADGTATDAAPNGNGVSAEAGAEDDDEETQTSTQRSDPTTAWVMAVYEDDAGDEQAWKRSITSSGSSEYRINGRVVTSKEYNEALEAEQILIKARNFLVFQGDVEAIAAQSSKDLTRLIEQISGSLEYKADYDSLKEEKERAQDEQQVKLAQRRGINSEIKQYQEQKREADSYAKKQEELDAAAVTQVLWKLYHFQQTIQDSTEEISKHQEELKEYRRSVATYEKQLEGAKREQASATRAVSDTERQIKRKDKEAEEKEGSLLPINEKISLSSTKVQTSKKRVEDITKERQSQSQALDKLQKDLANVQKAQGKWETEWRAAQQATGRELSASDLAEYGRLRSDVSKQTAASQIKADNLNRQLKTDQETVTSLKSKVDSAHAQVTRLEGEISDLTLRRNEIGSDLKSVAKETEAKKKAYNAMRSERLRTKQHRTELEEKLHDTAKRLEEAEGTKHMSEKEARIRATVAEMKRLFPGVRGQLWSLCKPKQKKYGTAVSTVLGRHHDAVVVDTEKTAKDCITYLKDQRIGQQTFIPLDTIMHKAPDASITERRDGVRLATDTIDYENAVERAVFYACGNAIICDSLSIARHLCFDRRVDAKAVTLEGTVIHKGGTMTGGQGPDQKNARKWDDADVENLRRMAEKFYADIRALPRDTDRQDQEETLHTELSALELRRAGAEDESKALDRNIESKRRELKHAQGQLSEARPRYNEQSSGLESLRAELAQHTSAISTVEDQVFAGFCSRLGYANIRAYESQQGSLQQEASQKKLEFATQISKLENQLSFEKTRLQGTESRIAKLERESSEAERTIESLEADRDSLSAALDAINEDIDGLNENLATQKTASEEKATRVSECRREVTKRSKSVEGTLKTIESLQAETSSANMGRYNLLKRCRMEKIDIPLNRGSRKIDSLPLQGGVEAEPDAMDIDEGDDSPQAPEVQDYGIDVDFDSLDDELKEDDSESAEKDLQEKLDDLAKELEKMAPNARANERLESTENRLRDYDAQYRKANEDATKAKRAFEKVRDRRHELFTRAFEHISEQIEQVYKDLTRTVSLPAGGSASLTLEDDEEPYLHGIHYHAMPPLKRFRGMEHLSGGEKTMAALALLFAIHTYAPSPFFVLDEVDAALDNANTTRLASYVREHARPGMQFVVISLKTGLFQNSETLVGVMRDQSMNSSRALTLDLRKYQAV